MIVLLRCLKTPLTALSILFLLAPTLTAAEAAPERLQPSPVTQELVLHGRGERLVAGATTDVWAHEGYAYTGTFGTPCGGDPEAGVWIWDVRNREEVRFVAIIPSPTGSHSNDVKVASMNSGDLLVHSNEHCSPGPGGFEIWNVDDPENPRFLAHAQVDEINPITEFIFGGSDFGVHNLWLFTQGDRDYVGAVSGGMFDNFQIFDITVPTQPLRVLGWGAEELFDPGVGELTDPDDPAQRTRVNNAALWLLDGFGSSDVRFLHDFTITPDGTRAYLANWDAGLILLDISDVTDPQVISVAIHPTSGNGEVNSHSVWPNANGTTVVEGEESGSLEEDGWGGLRIWDYSDPSNPVLASTFNTMCSANPAGSSCNPSGTYTAHNVVIEDDVAYVSWLSDGMRVVDLSDPYNPTEIARFFDDSADFLAENGGNQHAFWGVYKEPNLPSIYGSDINGGLYVFQVPEPDPALLALAALASVVLMRWKLRAT